MKTRTTEATKNHEEALDRFIDRVCEIRTTLEAIQKAADEHFGWTPDEIHWGHVGSAGHVLEGLKEILEFVNGSAE